MGDNFFAELQLLSSNADNSVEDARRQMDEIVQVFKALPDHRQQLEWFANIRGGLDPEILEEADSFMVDEDYPLTILPEELRHDSLGFVNNYGFVYSGRYVYPIKDPKGHVAGWCGYDAFELPKYLDSINYGYVAKSGMLYGMENIEKYYKSKEPVFITEGIVCALWLRSKGFQALALLGSYISPYVATILKRLGNRCIVVPDADEAGNKLRRQVKYTLPNARCIQSRIAKDIDDSRKVYSNLDVELRKVAAPFGRSEMFQ